ncbi:MAG: mycothione reductase [Arcanobacterium sp.]|nr:mycothione reductase [Arcanobacterium sp.]
MDKTNTAIHYDLIIIGAGSGNSIPGPEFSDWKIAIIDSGKFGGTCLNVGCIPTKMFVYPADLAYNVANAEKLGLDFPPPKISWADIVERIFPNRIDQIAASGEAYRRGPETPNIDVYNHQAHFIAPKTIATGIDGKDYVITADQIVLATGSRPQIPQIIADSGVRYYTNEDVMRLSAQPKSMIILGGGFIAAEFAHVFASLGTEVTVVNRSPMLRKMDEDISRTFNELNRQRFNLHLGRTVAAVENITDGVRMVLDNGEVLEAEILLVATGRIRNSDNLGLEAAGVAVLPDGRIDVDIFGRSLSDPNIWALGDLIAPEMLKHVANAHARTISHNLEQLHDGQMSTDNLQPLPQMPVPAAVFSAPQIASVGLTEAQALESEFTITVKIQKYGDTAYGWAMEDQDSFCKLIADRNTGKLLGAHYLGPQASTLIQQMITVITHDIDLREYARSQYWIHPALAEVTENAILGLEFAAH